MDEERWKYGTHDGARLAMLEQNLKMTVRQRLEIMQALNQLETPLAHEMRERERHEYYRRLFSDDG